MWIINDMEPSNEAQANDAAITLLCRYVVQDANGNFHSSTQETNLVMAICIYIYSKVKTWWVGYIIESVDSNVGIARTRNIWQYIKISPNLKNGELVSLYDNVPFIFECFHDQQDSQWREKASWRYQTRNSQNGQNVFLSFFFFFFFRRASSVLSESLTMVLAWNSSILHWAVHCPIAFFTTPSTPTKRSKNALELYGFVRTPFCNRRVRMRTKSSRSNYFAAAVRLANARTTFASWRFVPTVRYFATQLLVLSSGCSHCHYELFHKISWYIGLLPHIAISAATYWHSYLLPHIVIAICYHILSYLLYSIAVRYSTRNSFA